MMFMNGAGRSCAISSRQLVCDHAWGQHQLMTVSSATAGAEVSLNGDGFSDRWTNSIVLSV